MYKKRRFCAVLIICLRIFLYAAQLLAFLGILYLNNRHLLRPNRTTGILCSTYAILMVILSRVYGGFRVGRQRSGNIIYQMGLSIGLADLFLYLQLQVMNVNARNNSHLELFTVDFLLLIAALIAQILLIIVIVRLGSALYFHYNPPRRCCLVTASKRDRTIILRKLKRFEKQFILCDQADYRDADLLRKMRRNQTVILFHLPAAEHQVLVEACYRENLEMFHDLSITDVLAQHDDTYFMDDVLMSVHLRRGLSVEQLLFKRIFDIFASGLCLLLFSPVFLASAIAIKAYDGGTIFYMQERVTRNGKRFLIYKFRTMRPTPAGSEYSCVRDDDRITPPGRILRKLRFDELPQLLNILKGEMSLVGPRPEMVSNVERYTKQYPEFSYRQQVKAGLTGYAQIMGKYNTSPRDKLMMDISYIENYSFWLDMKLVLNTLTVFFKRDSTEPFEQEDMPEDMPNDNIKE